MTRTLQSDQRDRQRNHGSNLRIEQQRDRMIRTAFLATTAALPARPASVRCVFDNAARAESPSSPWASQQAALRAAAAAAALSRRPITINETRVRIEGYYATLCADALSALPASDVTVCPVQSVLTETDVQGPADVAQARYLAKPTCRERLQQMVEWSRRHARELMNVADTGERHLWGNQGSAAL